MNNQTVDSKRKAQAFVAAAADFEKSKIDEIKASRKLAWSVAAVFAFVCAVNSFTAAYAVLARDPAPPPVVLRVDNATGDTTVLRAAAGAPETVGENVRRAELRRYVIERENYDWSTISTDLAAVKLKSSDDVAKEFDTKVRGKEAPLNVLKDKGKIVVKVSSVVFTGQTAQVRFVSQKLSPNGENNDNSPEHRGIATITWSMNPEMKMTDQERLVNPWGLKVESYREDPEVVQ